MTSWDQRGLSPCRTQSGAAHFGMSRHHWTEAEDRPSPQLLSRKPKQGHKSCLVPDHWPWTGSTSKSGVEPMGAGNGDGCTVGCTRRLSPELSRNPQIPHVCPVPDSPLCPSWLLGSPLLTSAQGQAIWALLRRCQILARRQRGLAQAKPMGLGMGLVQRVSHTRQEMGLEHTTWVLQAESRGKCGLRGSHGGNRTRNS